MIEEANPTRAWTPADRADDTASGAAARRGNRRRLRVFGLSFVTVLLLGQAWNFSRPAEYRASTRLQVDLPELGRPGQSASGAYATKLQLFDSRPLLAKLADRLQQAGLPAERLGPDPAARLQAMLQVRPVSGSEVVELQATGPDARVLADVLNAIPEVIREEIGSRQSKEADAQLAAARQQLARLEQTATDRRDRLDSFRQRAGVLAERDDNDAVARVQGLNRALDAAVEKEAAAAARVAAVGQAVEQGKSSTQVRTDPTLSGLETRAHQVREELKELERSYTADFLALDPRARALRSRLAELESQVVQQRGISQQAALQAAQEEYAGARAQVERLRAQLGAARPALAKTSTRLAEAKVLEEDLAQVDKARRDLLERVSRLEADELRRVAAVTVVDAATVPTAPWRPDYGRDAAWVLAAAAAFALALMAVVEAFNRSAPPAVAAPNTTVVLAPAWRDPAPALQHGAAAAPLMAAAAQPATAVLPAPLPLLSQPEAAALLSAGDGMARALCAFGLMGLTIDEALALRTRHLDRGALRLQVGGAWARELPLPRWLAQSLPDDRADDDPVLHDAVGQPLTSADVASMLIGAALDARIEQAPRISWQVLRDTAIDWWIGQGVRYTELSKVVGRVDAHTLQSLASRPREAPAHAPQAVAAALMPALQLDPGA